MSRRNRCNTLPGVAGSSTIQPQATVSNLIDSALTRPRAGLRGAAAVAQLADDMRPAGQREGGITETDLLVQGWKRSQLIEHGEAARTLADQLSMAA